MYCVRMCLNEPEAINHKGFTESRLKRSTPLNIRAWDISSKVTFSQSQRTREWNTKIIKQKETSTRAYTGHRNDADMQMVQKQSITCYYPEEYSWFGVFYACCKPKVSVNQRHIQTTLQQNPRTKRKIITWGIQTNLIFLKIWIGFCM